MIRVLANLLLLSWSLWFGGMVVLLLFVTRLFAHAHETGVTAAPVLFDTFATLALIVGAIACCAATGLTIFTRRRAVGGCTLLLLLALAAAIVLRGWTHRIDRLREANQSQSAQFKRLHALSGAGYVTAAVSLLLGGVGMFNLRPTHRIIPGTAPAADFPVATSG